MLIDEKLVSTISRHEGFMPLAYTGPGGATLIGYGRNIGPGGLGVTEEEAGHLLRNDIARTRAELVAAYVWFGRLSKNRADAIIMTHFIMGDPVFRTFKKALAAMEEGDYETAADEFLDSRWGRRYRTRASEIVYLLRNNEYPDTCP